MGRLSARVEVPTKVNPKSRYVIRRQFMGGGTYGSYPGDVGLIIPKLLNRGHDEQLIRIGYIEEYADRHSIECGGCGNKFSSMRDRDAHFRRRHGERRGPRIVNIEDLSEAQRQDLKEQAAQYDTNPSDFMVPDPEESELLAEEKVQNERAPLYMDKTVASRRK